MDIFFFRYDSKRTSGARWSDIERTSIEILVGTTWNGTQVMDKRPAMISFTALSRKTQLCCWLSCLLAVTAVTAVQPAFTSKFSTW